MRGESRRGRGFRGGLRREIQSFLSPQFLRIHSTKHANIPFPESPTKFLRCSSVHSHRLHTMAHSMSSTTDFVVDASKFRCCLSPRMTHAAPRRTANSRDVTWRDATTALHYCCRNAISRSKLKKNTFSLWCFLLTAKINIFLLISFFYIYVYI